MGKSSKTIYLVVGFVIMTTLLYPLYTLVLGPGGIWETINIIKDAGATDPTEAIRIISMFLGALLIVTVLATPLEQFKSPINYSIKQAAYTASKVLSKDSDIEQRKQLAMRLFAYTMLVGVIWVVYFFLITNIQASSTQGTPVTLIASFGIIIIVALGNSWGVSTLIEKNGNVEFDKEGQLVVTMPGDNKDENQNNMLFVVLVIIANIVFLGVGLILNANIEGYLTDTGIAPVLEGDATNLFGN